MLTAAPAVLEAAVVSVPDGHYGEVVGAWVVREPSHGTHLSKEDVRKVVATNMNPQVRMHAFSCSSSKSSDKMSQNAPRWVWFVGEDGYDELPKTASGKVQKHVLRKWSKELAQRGVGSVQ